jgi:hypothetical protein
LTIDIINPNNIELSVTDLIAQVTSESDVQIGTLIIDDSIILPQTSSAITAHGKLQFAALDADSIDITLSGTGTGYIAGIEQSLDVSASASIVVPSIEELLLLQNESLDFSLIAGFKVRFRGFLIDIQFKVYNPSNIPLEASNLVVTIYGVTNDQEKIIITQPMEPCLISSKNEVCIGSNLTIPYLRLLTAGTGRILPQWFKLTIAGDFAVEGTSQTLPISINGFVDPHIFT